jgi:hypothetical protein
MTVSWGDYWDGTQYAFRPGATVRFNEKFSLSPSYSYNHIDLPTGIFVTHTVIPSPDVERVLDGIVGN